MNTLYFGDCLHVLREHIPTASVDLIYLDPPFNSKRDYSVLFKSPKGHDSDAQITAFEDSWHWGQQAETEFGEILANPNTDVAELMQALRSFLGENDMMAYLTMMANRLLQLHRVLASTGSIYLHCDPTASHYLKIVLDGVFGKTNYRSEISWKRSSAHNDAKQGRQIYGNIRDVLLFYSKSGAWTWNWQYSKYSDEYVETFYKFVDEATGRRYYLGDLTAAKPGGDTSYDFHGTKPYKGRYWAYSREKMEAFREAGRLYFPSKGGTPRYKHYLDEMPGIPLQNDWSDIRPASKAESLGYPTQKPLSLLERIIATSSNVGDVVLDPFCGCGTAVHAAQQLGRKWIGVDITHIAIDLIEKRLRGKFQSVQFEVYGRPEDYEGAVELARRDKYQFQWWACSIVNANPYQGKKKGSDGGIDGLIFFHDDASGAKKIIVSVKGGSHVGVDMVKNLIATVQREKAEIGLFVTLAEPTKPMITEAVAAGFYKSPHHGSFPKIQILTIKGLLDGSRRAEYPDLTGGKPLLKQLRRTRDKAVDQGNLGI